MRRQVYLWRRAGIRSLILFLLIAAILVGFLIRMDRAIRPNLCAVCESETKRYATQVLSNAISETLDTHDFTYTDLVTLVYDTNGNITAMETRSDQVNRLQSTLLDSIQTQLEACRDVTLEVALGTATGVWLFAERGPHVSVQLMPIGNAAVELISKLESAGINQTCHTIYANVTAEIRAAIPFSETTATVEFSYLITETILVGDVPKSYLSLGDTSPS